MEGICRGCLVKFNDLSEINTYSERNRRLFVYSTGIQVKCNDTLPFQLCKPCYCSMKVSCNFKKLCRTSDRKLKNFLYLKDSGDSVDFSTFLKINDDNAKIRFPINCGTPIHNKNKEDDNVSTSTSIQNFMKDILQGDEIPDNEARIISEVIQEEADISDNSLDSHWLQDDVSIDTDFRLDFSFSAFSTPRSINNNQSYTLQPNIYNHEDQEYKEQNTKTKSIMPTPINANTTSEQNKLEFKNKNQDFKIDDTQSRRCVIDKNLESALRDGDHDNFSLEAILATPPMIPNAWTPSTPTINKILFGEKLEDVQKSGHHIEKFEEVEGTINVFDELITLKDLTNDTNQVQITNKETVIDNKDVTQEYIEMAKSNQDLTEINQNGEFNHEELINVNGKSMPASVNGKSMPESEDVFKKPLSPIDNKCSIEELYCKLCDMKLNTLRSLKLHMLRRHKLKVVTRRGPMKRSVMICDYCGKKFSGKALFLKHIALHMNPEMYRCKKCLLIFSTEARLKMHQSTHTGVVSRKPVEKKHVCTICGATFSSMSNCAAHARRHTGEYSYTCEECGAGFYRKGDFTVHVRKHTGERPFQCNVCSRAFARQGLLNNHIKRHTKEQPFSCRFCGKKFATTYNLKLHQNRTMECLRLQEEIAFSEEAMEKQDVSLL